MKLSPEKAKTAMEKTLLEMPTMKAYLSKESMLELATPRLFMVFLCTAWTYHSFEKVRGILRGVLSSYPHWTLEEREWKAMKKEIFFLLEILRTKENMQRGTK